MLPLYALHDYSPQTQILALIRHLLVAGET